MKVFLSPLAGAVLGNFLAWASPAPAQYGELKGLKVLKPDDLQDAKPVPAPKGSVVLFDGSKESLEGWETADDRSPVPWKLLDDGSVEVHGGGIKTKKTYDGHFTLHVEFRVPYEPENHGQNRGNSGIYLQGRYEVQVLDSYGLDSKDNDCGAIYEVSAPKVNACKTPTVWQSYDIDFHAPECRDGKKTRPARITVVQNGRTVQDNVEITKDNTRAGLGGDPCSPGPIYLQDHGHPVQYRNIWLIPVKD